MCSVQTTARPAVTLCVAAGLLAAWVPGLHAEQQRAPSPGDGPAWFVSAVVTIRHQRVGPDGPLGTASPEVRYRLVRELRGGRWVTRMDLTQLPSVVVTFPDGERALTSPLPVTRVELDDGPGGEVWLVGGDGRRRAPVSDEARRLLGGEGEARPHAARPVNGSFDGDWIAEPGRLRERRDDLVRRLGVPRGRVRGLDRYVREDQDGRQEVLVAPDSVLPVEILTTLRTGERTHTTLSYEELPGVGHVRRLLRTDQHQGTSGGAITEVELSDVVVSGVAP